MEPQFAVSIKYFSCCNVIELSFLIVTFFTNAAVNEKGQHSAYLKAVVQYQYGSSSVAFWDFELAF